MLDYWDAFKTYKCLKYLLHTKFRKARINFSQPVTSNKMTVNNSRFHLEKKK